MSTKEPFPKHEAAPIPACEACGAFNPDCLVPDGEGAMALCWPCAHAHVDHEMPLSRCALLDCDCEPAAIYPQRVLEARREQASRIRE